MDDTHYMSRYDAKTHLMIAVMIALIIGFLLGCMAEAMHVNAKEERLFWMLRSDDPNQQACANLAIRKGKAYSDSFLDNCVNGRTAE